MASRYGLDKFYTKNSIVDMVLSNINLSLYSTVIEPSAGNGSFSKKIKNCIALDIKPEDDTIIKMNFFHFNYSNIKQPILIIGNPPFGRNGNLALKFIKQASLFSNTIAFILPKSFKKQSIYNRIPLNFWKDKEINIPENSFCYMDEEVNIPCVFQIYNKRKELRTKVNKTNTKLFKFTSKEEANVSIRRVGVYAGKASLDLEKSVSSHYFIKVKNPLKFINEVNKIEWEHDNTVGPRSISKTELINAIENI
ncbi:MAG TPA: hypothetical protein VMZ91_05280 [Candidatus Paceibacterota bacterium]|nr:hypothetical protein [Candidatus Paceibacterota bacterium]